MGVKLYGFFQFTCETMVSSSRNLYHDDTTFLLWLAENSGGVSRLFFNRSVVCLFFHKTSLNSMEVNQFHAVVFRMLPKKGSTKDSIENV